MYFYRIAFSVFCSQKRLIRVGQTTELTIIYVFEFMPLHLERSTYPEKIPDG
jgi:hypothetical protein